MSVLTLERSKERLTGALVSWQLGAIGLLVLAVLVNMAQQARIVALKEQLRADEALRQSEAALWEAKLELGEVVLQAEADKQARVELAAAYEMIGEYRYIGECTITAYCPCEECCGRWADGLTATGLPAGPGIVAVDESVIPLGSTVIIDGQKYLAADTGVTGHKIDIAMSDHQSALDCGVKKSDVWIIPAGRGAE